MITIEDMQRIQKQKGYTVYHGKNAELIVELVNRGVLTLPVATSNDFFNKNKGGEQRKLKKGSKHKLKISAPHFAKDNREKEPSGYRKVCIWGYNQTEPYIKEE